LKKLFWGFFFIYLNFNLNFNQHSLNVLPDFWGYILLMKGMQELADESSLFEKARPFAAGMAVYTGVLWVGALLGIASEGGWIAEILNLVATVIGLYVSWVLIQGVLEVEGTRGADLNGERLLTLWKALVAVQIVTQILRVMLNLSNVSVLAAFSVLLIIAGLIVIVMYLIAWKKAAENWEARSENLSGFEME